MASKRAPPNSPSSVSWKTVRFKGMKWPSALSDKPKARCASASPHCTPCCTAWSNIAGFAVVGKPAPMAVAAAVIGSRPQERKSFHPFGMNGQSCLPRYAAWPRYPMPDWQQIVSSKLSGLALEPEEATQVLEEVAGHLEEDYQALLSEGVSEKEAASRALQQVDDWQVLKQMIESARKKENP